MMRTYSTTANLNFIFHAIKIIPGDKVNNLSFINMIWVSFFTGIEQFDLAPMTVKKFLVCQSNQQSLL